MLYFEVTRAEGNNKDSVAINIKDESRLDHSALERVEKLEKVEKSYQSVDFIVWKGSYEFVENFFRYNHEQKCKTDRGYAHREGQLLGLEELEDLKLEGDTKTEESGTNNF